jgi:hypothetical protein
VAEALDANLLKAKGHLFVIGAHYRAGPHRHLQSNFEKAGQLGADIYLEVILKPMVFIVCSS